MAGGCREGSGAQGAGRGAGQGTQVAQSPGTPAHPQSRSRGEDEPGPPGPGPSWLAACVPSWDTPAGAPGTLPYGPTSFRKFWFFRCWLTRGESSTIYLL